MPKAESRFHVGATTDDVNTSRTTIDEQGAAVGALTMPRRLAPRAANAATHGLTATRYLPEILGTEVLERHRQRFRAEWQPSTPTQAFLVEELARHAAALDRATPIEEAVLRTAARALSGISDADGDEDTGADRVLAAACGSETLDRVTRYRRAHEKAINSALARLLELRATSDAALPPAGPPLAFHDNACLRYLQAHRDSRKLGCPWCEQADGKWLVGRELWQCRGCRQQVSARQGTVMERSPISLRTWFAAIAAILQFPQISTGELCDITGIGRPKTVRKMVRRIREAIDSPEAERLLAGLDTQILKKLAGSGC